MFWSVEYVSSRGPDTRGLHNRVVASVSFSDARIGSGSSGSWKTRVSSRMALVAELRGEHGL